MPPIDPLPRSSQHSIFKENLKGCLICYWKKINIYSGWVHPKRNLSTEIFRIDHVMNILTQPSWMYDDSGGNRLLLESGTSKWAIQFLRLEGITELRWQYDWTETNFLGILSIRHLPCAQQCTRHSRALDKSKSLRSPNPSIQPIIHSFKNIYWVHIVC